MEAATTDAPPARLKARYFEEIRPSLIERFEYSSVMQAPRVEKITLNMGVGLAKQDSKVLKAATEQLATIAGQQPSVRRARKSIAAFKLREGMPVGVAVTLRGERAYEFLDRLVSVAIPRIRDFRGLNPRSFDGRGNYSMGVREQIIFPEIDYDAIDQVRGLDITISTSAASDREAFALLQALGMPFAPQGRPKGFDPQADEAEAEARAAAHAAKLAEAPVAPAKAAPETAEEPAATAEADASPETAEPEASPDSAEEDATAETAEPEAQPAAETAEAEAPEDAEQGDAPEAAGEDTADAENSTPESEQAAETAEKESTD
ncbi:MAG: large subunit ribosomal protein [Solirubrobacteraceae bacterium]|jgi:large subunit ribosomal protein L5|nr:large subunit ribosomal protein [Solirubrobacteraceae bacterium]